LSDYRALPAKRFADSNPLPSLDWLEALSDDRFKHDDLIRSMAQFDVGLALEREGNVGAALTVSNKIGSYLLAGLAIAATDTPGQREMLSQISSAGFLYPSGRPKLLAEGLRRWLDDRNALRGAQQAAWDAARRRFCWDVEKENLLQLLESS